MSSLDYLIVFAIMAIIFFVEKKYKGWKAALGHVGYGISILLMVVGGEYHIILGVFSVLMIYYVMFKIGEVK